MKVKKSLTAIALSASVATAAMLPLAAASWSKGHGGMHHDPGRMVVRMAERLDLDDAQRQKVEQILGTSREQTDPYRDELKGLRAQLHGMRGNFDADTARSVAERIGEITGQMVYESARTQSEIYDLLSEAQREELNQMMEERQSRQEKRRQKDTR